MSRHLVIRLCAAAAAALCSLALAGCFSEAMFATNERASKQLSPEMVSLIEKKGMTKNSPILVRIFKEESELEVWKQTTEGKYDLLKTYPICRWSGDLGPKVRQGDRQAPEGFYTITPGQMNPNSAYYLSFNIGFPNAFDRSLNRTGSNLMVHGDCSSAGCYAMTDEQIGEIFALAREAFAGGQRAFQVQAYPFRMTAENMAKHRNNPNIAFWRMLKEGNDHFEVTRQEPKVDVCDRKYVFNAIPFDPAESFNAQRQCPVFDQPIEVSEAVKEKRDADNKRIAELVARGTPTVPVRQFADGGMNPVFAAKYPEHDPKNSPRVMQAEVKDDNTTLRASLENAPADTPAGTTAMASASDERPGLLDKIGTWLKRNPEPASASPAPPPPQMASAAPAPAPKTRTASMAKPKPETQAEAKPAPRTARSSEPQPQKEAQQQSGSTLPGSTPILSAGGFTSFR